MMAIVISFEYAPSSTVDVLHVIKMLLVLVNLV